MPAAPLAPSKRNGAEHDGQTAAYMHCESIYVCMYVSGLGLGSTQCMCAPQPTAIASRLQQRPSAGGVVPAYPPLQLPQLHCRRLMPGAGATPGRARSASHTAG